MQNITEYPRFIPDKPIGVDCFEGHSQERLAHSVCDYVRRIDAQSEEDGQTVTAIPRIVGLEGGWGTGKSNVVRMIEGELAKEGYYTFTYDAWGHQEDLQRRSILETMTSHLIEREVLQGKVNIQMRNGRSHKDTWANQLSLLLSNKTTTIRKSMPKLSGTAVWGICLVAAFAVLSAICGILLEKVECFPVWVAILMELLPIIVGGFVAFYYSYKDGNWNRTLKLISQREDDTIDEEYTSSEEPSVAEFKHWMRAVSRHIETTNGVYDHLIIVFDNMDRLPSEKVMQLWSSIYTFFAGGEFKNIWAVIPYDYKHLCQAIYGSETDAKEGDENAERIKQFISKTFPITYHVPEPVITDYKKLFYTYFDAAFGTDEHDREHICQVFTHLNEHPNPRTVIRFVNDLVAMRLQWGDSLYRLQNQALYILKRNYLFYSGKNLDTQLLSNQLFDKIGAFYPDKDKVRTELCQYAYGLEDVKLAGELPLRNELKRKIGNGESISEYVGKPNFLTVFEDVMNDTDQAMLNNVVMSMASLDEAELTPEVREQLQSKWDFLTNMKADAVYDGLTYDITLTTLIQHGTPKRVVNMAKQYVAAMQRLTVSDGAAYFQVQQKLQDELKASNVVFDDSEWYQKEVCMPEHFVEYVCKAKEEYQHYGLTADVEQLNEYLLNGAMSGNGNVAMVVKYIRGDKAYDLSYLKTTLAKAIEEDSIKEDICAAAYVHRVLSDEEGVMKSRFKPETVAAYLNGNHTPWAEKLPMGLEDVMAMSLADGNDLDEIDDEMLPRICECMDSYFNYTELLEHLGKVDSAYRKLNRYCIEHLKGGPLNTTYAAKNLEKLQTTLGVEQTQLLKQFNRWPAIDWGEINADNEFVKEVRDYVHQTFFTAYRDNPGNFSDSIIMLGVMAMECQDSEFLAKIQRANSRSVPMLVVDDYWKSFVMAFLGTDFMKDAGTLLTKEAVTMLQWLYDHNEVKEPELINTILQHGDEATLKSYLHQLMNDHLSKTDINQVRFPWFGKLLPLLGADMDANTARGLMTHFIKPIYKDSECAAVFVEYKTFYLAVMAYDMDFAVPIVREMVDMESYAVIKNELDAMLPKEKTEKE